VTGDREEGPTLKHKLGRADRALPDDRKTVVCR